MAVEAPDVCSHGRPMHIDLINDLHEALRGEKSPARPTAPKAVWDELIEEVRVLADHKPKLRDGQSFAVAQTEFTVVKTADLEALRDRYHGAPGLTSIKSGWGDCEEIERLISLVPEWTPSRELVERYATATGVPNDAAGSEVITGFLRKLRRHGLQVVIADD